LFEVVVACNTARMYVHEAVQDVRRVLWHLLRSLPNVRCRLVNDYNQEVTESHAGKVVERHW
jgi:hypothetical protein